MRSQAMSETLSILLALSMSANNAGSQAGRTPSLHTGEPARNAEVSSPSRFRLVARTAIVVNMNGKEWNDRELPMAPSRQRARESFGGST